MNNLATKRKERGHRDGQRQGIGRNAARAAVATEHITRENGRHDAKAAWICWPGGAHAGQRVQPCRRITERRATGCRERKPNEERNRLSPVENENEFRKSIDEVAASSPRRSGEPLRSRPSQGAEEAAAENTHGQVG